MSFLGYKLPPDQISGDIGYYVGENTSKHIRLVDGKWAPEQAYCNSHWSISLHVDQSEKSFVLWCKVYVKEENHIPKVAEVNQDKHFLLVVIADDSDYEMDGEEDRNESNEVCPGVLGK